MKTALIIGSVVVAASAVAACIYFKKRNIFESQQSSKNSFLRNIFKNESQFEIREVEALSMRTFGSWIKEHDFPTFAGYKFFVIKDQNMIDKKKNPNDLYVYGFCITDAKINIIDKCIYLSKEVDSSFATRVVNDVNEIVIK